MAKLYIKPDKQNEELTPKNETISFILNYSKALNVVTYKKMKFEAFQN